MIPGMKGWTEEQKREWAAQRVKAHVATYGSKDVGPCAKCGKRHHWAAECGKEEG